MNEYKVSKKISKKYGVSPTELCNLSTSRIKHLKASNALIKEENDKLKVVKKPLEILIKGGSLGAGIAGSVNTAFPNVVPVIGSAITSSSGSSSIEKALNLVALSSKPIDVVSGPAIIGIGAVAGAILYGGYRIVKAGYESLSIVSDRRKAKRLAIKK